jgi:valyl-tRNA synthetase
MELSKNYNPAGIEDKWYSHWLQKGYFKSTPDSREPFTIVIPPPNVTGVLHMGHTLNETVQDILIRKARMSGYNACWVPGSDHASIATEAKVVGMLKEKGIDKNNLSREEFLKYAFEWKDKYGDIIYGQLKKLGCSVDWDRTTFTMDDHYYKAVIKVFVDLYKKGLVYRGARMINWDPVAKTALSDEEVEYKEITGKLYYIKYLVVDSSQLSVDSKEQSSLTDKLQPASDNFIVIATQRPETIMGDTAVCANPTDERYSNLKGKSVLVPLINKKVPIIFDDYVDKEFGTGILKITPAHDINDYNLGLKHNLAVVDTLNDDGTLSEAAQIYVGEDRFVARKKIIEELQQKGHLVKEEEYQTRLGYSQRTNAVAEPKISTQWFVKMKELAEPALKAVVDGEIKIHPGEKFLATYKYWLENVKDWCISRQLWWGQQIPAWYDEEGNLFVAETEEEAMSQKLRAASSELRANSSQLVRDEDVLDTWFSSWLWPMEVFNGITEPDNDDINYYYPSSVLVTGQDIIFFWVARMIMAGMEYKKEKPFSDVYFTGMVRDKQGRKMSKQLGNSPDLLELIEKYGADAVRFGIMISSPAGNDLLFDEASLEQGRNFNNKIWNALKLIKLWEGRTSDDISKSEEAMMLSQLAVDIELGMMPVIPIGVMQNENFATEWFENRLNEVTAEIEILYKQFRLSEALKIIYSLIWDDFCSWYLEWVKPGFEQPIDESVYYKTVYFFEQLMQLLHPFMPFVTEEIYHLLREQKEDIIIKQFEKNAKPHHKILEQGELLKNAITSTRDVRNKNQIKPKDKIKLYIQTEHKHNYESIEKLLTKQVNAESFSYTNEPVENSLSFLVNKDKFFLETEQAIDTASQKEQLQKDLEHLKKFLISVEIRSDRTGAEKESRCGDQDKDHRREFIKYLTGKR